MRLNLPNQITLARLCLAVLVLALLSCFDARQLDGQRWLLNACFWLFLVAGVTDVLDGLLARMLRSVTSFGRILDPVVDKIMVCGAFVLFASQHFWDGHNNIADVQPWMVVVIVGRELLVSAFRAESEAEGREFGASWVGKLKMFFQCVAVCVVLGQLAWNLESLAPLRTAAVWVAVAVTAMSAVSYLHRARTFFLSNAALGAAPPTGPTTGPSGGTQPATDAQRGESAREPR